MTSPALPVSAGCGGGGGCSGSGITAGHSPRAALSGCALSAGCTAPGSPSHPPSRDVACQGYVGQGARPAGQYHECDFDWHDHAAAVRHLVEAQEAAALALRARGSAPAAEGAGDGGASREDGIGPHPAAAQSIGVHWEGDQQQRQQQQQQQQQEEEEEEGPSGGDASSSGASAVATATARAGTAPAQHHHSVAHRTQQQPQQPQSTIPKPRSRSKAGSKSWSNSSIPAAGSVGLSLGPVSRPDAGAPEAPPPSAGGAGAVGVYEGGRWEEFYRAHPSARFFKERRYLLLEFPELLRCGHVAEIGCGCGSSILPVLKANPAARTTCTDISTTCLAQLRDAAAAEGIAPSRISVFPADATDPAAAPAFDGIDADALLIMFTLSAVTPERQAVMLSHAWRALAPGGRLMLRDHGLYDMVQLRIPADQWVGSNLYKRGDGTMAYFFSTEDLVGRATGAGFETVECKYVTVINRNRRTGVELRRVFVHGVFEKPAAC